MFEHLLYNPHTGDFTRKDNGKPIGWFNKGYKMIYYKGKRYYAHRVAWYLTYGQFPPNGLVMDHINQDKSDNRLVNLRLATPQMNGHNRSNHRGYGWHSNHNCWQAYIRVDNKLIHLGYFSNEWEARRAYLTAKPIYHPTAP